MYNTSACGRGGIGIRARLRGVWETVRVQVPSTAPSVPTLGTASELVRYDRLAFLYANPGPMPPFSPVFRRITRLGLQHGPGSFVNSSDQPSRESVSRGIIRIYRVPRVRRVIRVIRVRIAMAREVAIIPGLE